jgi:hypothetical protein
LPPTSASLSYKCKFDNTAACGKTWRNHIRWERACDRGWRGIIAQGEEVQQDEGDAGNSIVSLVNLMLEGRRKGWEEENKGRNKRNKKFWEELIADFP